MLHSFLVKTVLFISVFSISWTVSNASAVPPKTQSKLDILTLLDSDKMLGDKKAKVLMIEFSSMSCPHCAEFHDKIFPTLKKEYIDTGKVLYITRDIPLNKPAFDAARLAHCAEGKYFQIADLFFSNQSKWAYSKDYMIELEKLYIAAGYSKSQANQCLSDHKLAIEISNKAMNAMNILQIPLTPVFFINQFQITGLASYDEFKQAIEKELTQRHS